MMRPSARRRPTALRIEKTDQKYVITVCTATFLSFAVAVYAYQAAQPSTNADLALTVDAIGCTALVLLGSSFQKLFAPLDGFKQHLHFSFLANGLNDVTCVLVTALETLARFCAMEQLGATRVISIILPSESLIRAHRAGFISAGDRVKLWLAAPLLLGIFLDLAGAETSKLNVLVGYSWLAISILSSLFRISHDTQHVCSQFVAGLLMTIVGLTVWSLCLLAPARGQLILQSMAIVASVVARAWAPTQPRAISTALKLVWPLVVALSIFISHIFSFGFGIWENLSLVMLYYALFTGVKSSSVASSSQSAANVIPSSRVLTHYGGYYINEVLKDKESRDIFYFLLLNLSFMVVQMLYGVWTNSLGLISDSIHMLFDCLALAVGLVAAVMSKWPASRAHPFGFAKVEIISGFANSIFLVLISLSIMIEAVERLMEPPEMTTDQLLLISTLGLAVNLVGIFAFNHGHHHGHGHGHGHDHSDSHAIKNPSPKPTSLPTIQTPRSARPGSGDFDHMMGLSPRPDFSNFAGFNEIDTPRRGSLNGLGLQIEPLGIISENTLTRSRGPPGTSSPSRSRSPVRRPGSPFKAAHEPSLDDVSEDVNDLSGYVPESLELPSFKDNHGHNHGDAHRHSHQEKGLSVVRDYNHKKHDSMNSDNHSMYAEAHDHSKSHLDSCSDSHPHTHSHTHSLSHDHGHTNGHKHADGHGHIHSHSHGHSHDHSHNMEGIFLHILADTLGSAGVIISTLLIRMFGWTGFDPLASIFIAVLIFLSVVPLLKSSFGDLLLTLQDDQEYTLREILGEVSLIKGVNDIPFIRFWVDGNGLMHGILTIRAGLNGDLESVRGKVKQKLLDGVDELSDVIVQVDRAE